MSSEAGIPNIIDTNVLAVARIGVTATQTDHDPSPEQKQTVANWLLAFIDSDARLALDNQDKIGSEYRRNISEQDIGHHLLIRKWDQARVDLFSVEYDENHTALIPDRLADVVHDHADRKFVAVALGVVEQHARATVFNATDTDWLEWTKQLSRRNIHVQQLLPEWIAHTYARKHG